MRKIGYLKFYVEELKNNSSYDSNKNLLTSLKKGEDLKTAVDNEYHAYIDHMSDSKTFCPNPLARFYEFKDHLSNIYTQLETNLIKKAICEPDYFTRRELTEVYNHAHDIFYLYLEFVETKNQINEISQKLSQIEIETNKKELNKLNEQYSLLHEKLSSFPFCEEKVEELLENLQKFLKDFDLDFSQFSQPCEE